MLRAAPLSVCLGPYTDNDLMLAVAAVKAKSLTVRAAARKYGVPHTTVQDRVLGRYTAIRHIPGTLFK